jgi:coenzyme PQQ precursor peptide PqqA
LKSGCFIKAGERLAPEPGVYDIYGREAEEQGMAWETPTVTEVAVGMEVTSYVSGEEEVLPRRRLARRSTP